MACLRAVVPDRLGIHDANGVGEDVRVGAERGVCGHETREKGVCGISLDVAHWYARLVKCRADDGVVLGVELELDKISRSRLNVVGVE